MNSLLGADFQTLLTSAGLVYAHYGKELISNILKLDVQSSNIELLFLKMYDILNQISLSHRVAVLNPAWNDDSSLPIEQFSKAVELVKQEFEAQLTYLNNSWIPARESVVKALENRYEVHPSGKILQIERSNLPYHEHFYKLEKEWALETDDICFVVSKNFSNAVGPWYIEAIPVSETNRSVSRVCIPWRGLQGSEMLNASRIFEADFVDINGSSGVAKTREGALAMAEKALQTSKRI